MPEGFPPGLDPATIQSLESQLDQSIEHRWLYSVVPVSLAYFHGASPPLVAALTGYCKGCGRAFSKVIPVDTVHNTYQETPMDVERFGCIA